MYYIVHTVVTRCNELYTVPLVDKADGSFVLIMSKFNPSLA